MLSVFGVIEQIPKPVIMGLAKKIRDERFRTIKDGDIDYILKEMQEEQTAGKIVMDEILSKLLDPEHLAEIAEGRAERFMTKPFDIFFLKDERDSRDDFV